MEQTSSTLSSYQNNKVSSCTESHHAGVIIPLRGVNTVTSMNPDLKVIQYRDQGLNGFITYPRRNAQELAQEFEGLEN